MGMKGRIETCIIISPDRIAGRDVPISVSVKRQNSSNRCPRCVKANAFLTGISTVSYPLPSSHHPATSEARRPPSFVESPKHCNRGSRQPLEQSSPLDWPGLPSRLSNAWQLAYAPNREHGQCHVELQYVRHIVA